MRRLRELLRRWLGVPEAIDALSTQAAPPAPSQVLADVRSLLEQARAEAMRAQALYRKHDAREELRVLSDRVDALARALGVEVVAAASGTGQDATITVLNDADLKAARRLLELEVLEREMRRMHARAGIQAAAIQKHWIDLPPRNAP